VKVGRPRKFDAEKALERAMELFWRKGYEGTSLDDLTERMGITRPSLYAAFGNKESLFRIVLDRYEPTAGAYRVRALQAPTARAFAKQLLEGAADHFGDQSHPPGCLALQSALVCSNEAEHISRDLRAHRLLGEEKLLRRLKRAKAEGDLPADSNPADLAHYLSAIIYGVTILAIDGASQKELRAVAKLALKQWPAGRNRRRHRRSARI